MTAKMHDMQDTQDMNYHGLNTEMKLPFHCTFPSFILVYNAEIVSLCLFWAKIFTMPISKLFSFLVLKIQMLHIWMQKGDSNRILYVRVLKLLALRAVETGVSNYYCLQNYTALHYARVLMILMSAVVTEIVLHIHKGSGNQ